MFWAVPSAYDFDLPVVCGSTTSRNGRLRVARKPLMSDLSSSLKYLNSRLLWLKGFQKSAIPIQHVLFATSDGGICLPA